MLLVAASLTACSSDEETGLKETPRPMIVDVNENPPTVSTNQMPPSLRRAAVPIATRGVITTSSTLSEFTMNYQANAYDYEKTGSGWNVNSWPNEVGADEKIDFFAYTRGTFNYNNGNAYLSYSVEETPSNQHDLLVAEHKQIAYSDNAGHVSLTFDHACAAVQVYVQITNTLRTTLGSDLIVNSIVLKNVNNSGDYYYATKTWSNQTGAAAYTLNNSDITVTTTPEALSCGHLFMIPQSRAANGITGTYLEINYTTSESKQAILPLNVDWEAGKQYTINIKLGTTTIQQ